MATPSDEEKAFRQARSAIVRRRTALLANTNDEIVRLLQLAAQQIRTILAAQPSDYQRWALSQLQREINQTLVKFGEEGAAKISAAVGDAWQLGQDLVDHPLAAGNVRVAGQLQAIDTRQLQAMRAFVTDRIKNVGVAAANDINTQLGLVVIGSQSQSDAISAVKAILGEKSRKRATTIVRDNLAIVYNQAAFERMKASAALVPGLQKQWRKSGKRHPRLEHDVIDGQVRDVDKPFTVRPIGKAAVDLMYPHDPAAPISQTINCGCTMIPFKSDWKVQFPGRAPGGREAGPTVRELLDKHRLVE